MATELRKTGISVVGDVPWGTHFCHFYETKQDLLDTLVPYFKAGLESKEFCVWVVSTSGLITVEEAKGALAKAVPDLDRHLSDGNIEIFSGLDWYLEEGVFNLERVTRAWDAKLKRALARGYEGMRVSGDTFWLTEKDWKDFFAYEKQLNESITDQPMTVLCTYPLAQSGASEVLDVVHAHQFAIARRQGEWEVIETPELILAKAEIKRLNETLQRATERTPKPSVILSYGVAVLSVTAALAIALWMESVLQSAAHVSLFLCAVMLSAWFGGVRPGLFAIALSVLAFAYILPPNYSLAVETREIPRLLIFALSALLVGSLSAALRSKAESLRHARDTLSETVQELKRTNVALQAENAERNRAEDALRRSEDHLRLVIDTIPTMAWSVRPDGVVDFVNQRWMHYTGLSLEEESQAPMRPIHPEDIPRVIERWNVEREVGEPYEEEMRLRRADGEYRWFLVRTAPLCDEQGNLVKWYGVSIDIEDRKQAEEALREAEQKYRDIFENAGEGIFQSTPEGKYIAANPALARMYGFASPEELIHSRQDISLQVYVDPTRREEFKCQLEEHDAVRGFEHEVFRKDGSRFWISVNAHAVRDERGAIQYYEGTAQDISERKAAEEKLKANSEQLRALSARLHSAREEEGTRIAREIHDELGSALTGLKWDLEEIDKQLSTPVEPLALVALREKFQTPMKLADLAITAIRRIASELRPSVLDDLGLLVAIEWQAQQFQSRTGIVCACDCSLEKVELTEEESTAVFRILQEALTNVLRHSQATKVDIKINKENGYFVLSVSDNGKGITESVKSEQQSLGILGMRERAHLIGGEIDIKGVEGKGTVVTVRVPSSGQDSVLKMTR